MLTEPTISLYIHINWFTHNTFDAFQKPQTINHFCKCLNCTCVLLLFRKQGQTDQLHPATLQKFWHFFPAIYGNHLISINFACFLCCLMIFFSKSTFSKNSFRITISECQTVWIQIRHDILLGLIWIQTACDVISRRHYMYIAAGVKMKMKSP